MSGTIENKSTTSERAQKVRFAIESALGHKLDVYQIRDICDILYIDEYPEDVQRVLNEDEFAGQIRHDCSMAKFLDKSIEEFYQTIIDQMAKDGCSADDIAQQQQYTDLALSFYYGHPEHFGIMCSVGTDGNIA